ncbi:SdrD B-like domain-containing protein [Polaromonas sp.]|uniref:SdrD B-like domain-containing protein n=1 Tax=Polaromonas sp. TaxID=1869339 RepID=UPI0032667A66
MMPISRPGLPCAPRHRLLSRRATRLAWITAVMLMAAPWATAQTTLNYTGALQTYTVPAGAGGVIIQANGAGGGSGGNDLNGDGGAGGAGARATGTYYIAPGTVLNVAVGQGGRAGNTSQGAFTCANAAGAGGLAGGAPGFAGGAGGQAGCSGWSGGGAGGGAASVVATAANLRLVIAGGGGGGQGGALDVPGRAGLAAPAAFGVLPGAAGTAGTTRVGDGSGGGGGGAGCPGGIGGAEAVDSSGTNTTRQSTGGSSCRDTTLVSAFGVTASLGGAGGASVAGTAPASGNPGGNGSVTITPIYPTLTVTKSQPSPALQVGINSVYTLTVATTTTTPAFVARVVDQLPVNMTYVSSSGTGWTCGVAANAGGTLVTCDFSGTITASGGTSVLQITAKPTSNITVTNYTAVDPAGGTSPPTATTCTAANTPSAGCAAPVVSAVALGFGGNVYSDANHNGNLDAGESGIGGASALWVKLVPRTGSVCNGPATVAASVTLSTGAYSFTNIQQGNYCLVVDGNSTLSDITAAYPAGFIGTQNPTGVIQFSIVGAPPVPQNFGLYSGSTLSGNVFADNGAGGGTANNGVKAGTEPGLAGITVNAMQGATTVDSEPTASDGSFILWVPAATSGTVVITPVLPSGYIATGGSAGTTGGSYSRPSVSYTAGTGLIRTGISFGMVAPNTLSPNGAQTAQPGTVVFYAHTYQAGTGGQVTFSMANTATPASPAWSQVLYQDSNCNAVLEASEPQVTAAITVTAGQTVCLIVKQFVPAGAGQGAQNSVTLSAAFSYTNAAPALAVSTLVATDITTVGQAGDLALAKLVSNITQAIAAATSVNASPGDTLQYTLTATNNGTQPLSTLFVSDSTPAFTGFVSTACPGALPTGITGCVVTTQPAVNAQGALKWTFTGSLASGAQLIVTYRVKVDQ